MKCLQCNNETTNPKFCSKSCAASYNNSRRQKTIYYCQKCGSIIGEGWKYKERMVCDNCIGRDWSLVTYGQLLEHSTRASDAHAHIRDVARRIYRRSDKPKCCVNCGYDKHYEVCHIHAIEDFAMETPVSVVNDIHNLVGLCPNCHWELDHGLLQCKDEWK